MADSKHTSTSMRGVFRPRLRVRKAPANFVLIPRTNTRSNTDSSVNLCIHNARPPGVFQRVWHADSHESRHVGVCVDQVVFGHVDRTVRIELAHNSRAAIPRWVLVSPEVASPRLEPEEEGEATELRCVFEFYTPRIRQ